MQKNICLIHIKNRTKCIEKKGIQNFTIKHRMFKIKKRLYAMKINMKGENYHEFERFIFKGKALSGYL